MSRLRREFEQLGLDEVETFIASGNVIFRSDRRAPASLEQAIEARLFTAFGFEVSSFIRSDAELLAITTARPFGAAPIPPGASLIVGFARARLGPRVKQILDGFRTPTDDFRTLGRELYWLCRTGQGKSKFSNAVFERKAGLETTFRKVDTVARLVSRYRLDRA